VKYEESISAAVVVLVFLRVLIIKDYVIGKRMLAPKGWACREELLKEGQHSQLES